MDLITTVITERFNQPGYRIYQNAEDLLLKSANGENFEAQFEFVTKFYKSDLHPQRLHQQLQILLTNFPSSAAKARLSDLMEYFGSLTKAQRELLSEVCTMFKLVLVMPSTNAASERSFSTLRRIKAYLRSTMTQKRLKHLMILHIYSQLTDEIDLIKIANEFVSQNEYRKAHLGSLCDLLR